LYLAWCDDAGTIRSDEPRLALPEKCVFDSDHVLLGNAFGDADNQWNFSIQSLENSSGGSRRRNVDHSGVGFGLGDSLKLKKNIVKAKTGEN